MIYDLSLYQSVEIFFFTLTLNSLITIFWKLEKDDDVNQSQEVVDGPECYRK